MPFSCPVLPRRRFVVSAALSLVALSAHAPLAFAQSQYGPQKSRAPHGMVASADIVASQVGVEIMKKGGNAVDASVAVGLVLAVTYPTAGNIGGGGFMLIRLANGKSTVIDYRETAPAAATHTMYLDAGGNLVPGASLIGYKAVGIPGTVAGFAIAQKKYGKLSWKEVVAPARKLAEQGFILSQATAGGMRLTKSLALFPESRRIFHRGGNFYKEGDLFKQPDLAQTLKRIEQNGPQEFYTGRTAQLIANDMAKNNGLVTLADLKNYAPVEREPLKGTYRGYEILTMPPPSSGGIALIEMLHMLETRDIKAMGQGSETDHFLIETMRRAFADRAEFLGDPDFVKVPIKGLTSKAYAQKRTATIDTAHATRSADVRTGDPLPYESSETTHYSVVDKDGNAVSNTYTLNNSYGCGATATGTGILLNNEMDDFASKPGSPNGYGLVQGEANAIAPRKRPLSSMTPTILTRDGKPFLVVGTPGGPTIITTVFQIIVQMVDFNRSVADALAAPRLHQQWLPDTVDVESFGLSTDERKSLEAKGHIFSKESVLGNKSFGNAMGIVIEPQTGMRVGAADPRASGAVAGY